MQIPFLKTLESTSKKLGLADPNGWSKIPSWAILPLRAFLGITFVYAGLQKITDPLFFDDASHYSIKYQLEIFSHSSPLRLLLIHLAIPHADLFGWIIALSELLVGLATLAGLFGRLTAGAGMFISGLLWLTATWSVSPYFLGPDSMYAMAWLTLLLTGMGDYSLDHLLKVKQRQEQNVFNAQQQRAQRQNLPPQQAPAPATQAQPLRVPPQIQRRSLLRALIAGGTVLALALVTPLSAQAAVPVLEGAVQTLKRLRNGGEAPGNGQTSAPVENPTPLPGTPAGAIGNVSQVPSNSAFPFTLKSNGDPALIIHLPDNKYVAFDAVCTHEGCTVAYDQTTQALICPCHGAAYDPSANAAVLAGPTSLPLTAIPLRIDSKGNMFVSS